MKHKFILLYSYAVRLIMYFLPNVPLIMRLRGCIYGLAMKRCGRNFQVASDVRLSGLEYIGVGDNCYLAPGIIMLISENCNICDEVMVGPYAVIVDGDHVKDNCTYRYSARRTKPINIGRGSWIGAHVTVTKGVTIGEGVAVGANSVVTNNIPDGCIVGGVPAKAI